MKYNILIMLIAVGTTVWAQVDVKEFYSQEGYLVTDENESYYYLLGKKRPVDLSQQKTYNGNMVFTDSVKAYYTKNDRLKSRLHYVNGMLQGNFIDYYESGLVKEKGLYVEGRKSGEVRGWHSNGKLQKVLKYYTIDKPYGMKELRFDIVDYWDSLGNSLVENGNGSCICVLGENISIREEGEVVNGKMNGAWRAFSGDTLRYEEEYEMGEFKQGKSYHHGNVYRYTVINQMAEMNGGIPALLEFLRKNIRYPAEAKRKGKEGKVFVKFTVDKDGELINPEVVRTIYPVLDEEALRVVRLMKKWSPGKLRGVPVKSQFVLPVYFKLG